MMVRGNPNGRDIIGDFNIDYLKRNRDVNKMKLKSLEEKYNLKQVITTRTRETVNTKSVIDLIFTTLRSDLMSDSGTLKNPVSDHLPTYLIRKKKREYHPKKTILVRKRLMYTLEI